MVEHRSSEKGSGSPLRHSTPWGADAVNDADVQKYAHDMNFPCSRQELLRHVRSKGAPQKVLDFIGQFHSDQFESAEDLSREADRVKH